MNTTPSVSEIFIWPRPQRVTWSGGYVQIPIPFTGASEFDGWMKEFWNRVFLRLWDEIEPSLPSDKPPKVFFYGVLNASLRPESYRLITSESGIRLEAAGYSGALHGLQTLLQIVSQRGVSIPLGCIEDWPDFPVRGFMLDVSRCKVPTLNALGHFIQRLTASKYNHLQLYAEHTYKFAHHEGVWGQASPLDAEHLDCVFHNCDAGGIELSANINSFGHFERWLKHPEYKHLAECPNGFEHPIKGKVPHGTTLRPNAASVRFLDKLWSEYLPLFKSRRFNLGGDEPWELGQGWSKPLVKKYGKHRVYLDFLIKLHKLAKKHGKEMLFWGDTLLESPELVREVPKDATALLWGYEADHPFAEQCAKLAKAKRKFWVCPGTSAWNTFTGRTDNMLANIESAAKHGLANGAEGFLLTSWGDGGNHQPWPIMYPGLVYAAGMAWNQKATRREDLPRAIDMILSEGKKSSGLGQILLEAGRIENAIRHTEPNRSRHHALFFATHTELKRKLKTLSASELRATAKAIEQTRQKLRKGNFWCGEEMDSTAEIAFGLKMTAWAVKRAQWTLTKKKLHPLASELRALIGEFEEHWVVRARSGGLHEASDRMRAVEKEL